MDLSQSPVLSALSARLRFLSARTGVIAENIANADTPDFAARDLAAPQRARLAQAAALKTSDTRHIARPAHAGASPYRIEAAPDAEASLNGNKVSLETQMMKLSQTRMDYQLASTVYRKGVELIRFAVRGGR